MSSNLKTALERSLDMECSSISEVEAPEYKFSAGFEKKMKKLIHRREKPYFQLICTAGRRAACVAGALVVISASAFSVKAVRETVYDFIEDNFSDHDVVTVKADEDSPATIENEYEITKLPAGFEETEHCATDVDICSMYSSKNDDKYILFEQFTKQTYNVSFDNEHTTEEDITDDNGQIYRVYDHGNGEYTFVWDNGKYILQISGNLDKGELLDLCRSTKMK